MEARLREAEHARDELARRLAASTIGSNAERELRSAALNLMEDAVTARRAEQEEIDKRRRVEEELRDADRRKDEFLAMLAHELRRPLAPIRNSLNVLRHGAVDVETTRRLLSMMDKQVSHVVRLVDDLLEVSRITQGRVELRHEAMDLRTAVDRAIEASGPLINAAGHTLEVALPEGSLTLDADPVRIAQVLTNLLNNAAKYTPAGGRIWLSAERTRDEVVITVRDTGAGIPSTMLSKVFDLFTQVDRTYDRAHGGLGIGLTLARRLVEMHRGRIQARSEGPDRGSSFVVTLPAYEGSVPPPAPSMTSLAGDREWPRPGHLRRRVLVVEDNVDSAETLGMLLEMIGDEVTCVNDGVSALSAIQSFRPKVVLLDIGMPGMDGYEVARRARQMPEGKELALIALTGWGAREDRRRAKEAGFDHHLVKPVTLETLEALLARLTEDRG